MTTVTAAFHFLTPTGVNSSDYGGILPPPLAVSGEVTIDGQVINLLDLPAYSGAFDYRIVEPGDYPTDENGRQKRAGSVRAK